MQGIGSSKRTEREAAASKLEMKLIDKIFYQDHSGFNSVDGSLAVFSQKWHHNLM